MKVIAKKMKEIAKKILIMNKLLLPNELIDIIKNYVFYNKMKLFHHLISNNIYYGKYEIPEYPYCPYPVIRIYDKGTDMKWIIYLAYCETCGKYVRRERLVTYINENLHCNC